MFINEDGYDYKYPHLLIQSEFVNRLQTLKPDSQYLRKPSEQPSQEEGLVLICNGLLSTAYHKYECRGLQNCTIELSKITKQQAVNAGRKPCGYCYN